MKVSGYIIALGGAEGDVPGRTGEWSLRHGRESTRRGFRIPCQAPATTESDRHNSGAEAGSSGYRAGGSTASEAKC